MATKRSSQESIPDYEALYNKAYDEVMKEKVDLRKYFPKDHLETMPELEKIVFTNRLQNYMILKKLGLDIGIPDFISKSQQQRRFAFLSNRDSDENWTPAMGRRKSKTGIGYGRKYARRRTRNFLQGKEVIGSAASDESQPPDQPPVKRQPFMGFRRILARRLLNHLQHELIWKKFLRQSLANRLIDPNECEILDPSDKQTLDRAIRKKQADYKNELRNRYPRRNVPEKNYHELEVPNEDEYILCEECNEEYLHGNCPVHGPVEFVKDKTSKQVDQTRKKGRTSQQLETGVPEVPQNPASRSIPDGLIIAPSDMPGAGFGVWTKRAFSRGTMFGPYGGVKVYSEMAAHASGYTWEIYKDGKIDHYIDAQDVSKSNWMRYVNCAASKSVQNVKAFQFSGSIYYRACVDIPVNVEMVVWYGEEYAEELGLIAKQINSLGCHEVEDGILDVRPVRAISRTAEHKQKMPSVVAEQNQTPDQQTGCGNDAGSRRLDGGDKQHHFLQEEKLRRHYNDGKDRPHKCSLCSKAFTMKKGLIQHMRIHTDDKSYKCTVCGLKSITTCDLNRHMMIHTGEKPYTCTVCGVKFNRQSHLNRHMMIHTGEKPYTCTVCGEKFNQQSILNRHMMIHTGEKPYTCTVCGMKFNRQSILNRHMMIHTGEKPYTCPVCGVKFNHQSNLNKHMRIHTGEKPYTCTVCGVKFNRQSTLNIHMRIHTGEKPYTCTVCGVKFNRQSNLNMHVRIHTGEKPYKCV